MHSLLFRRIIACALLPAHVASCTSWRVEPLRPEQVVDSHQPPSQIRLTLVDSSRVVLEEPRVSADSLIGRVRGDRWAVAVREIAQVEVRRGNTLKTALLVAGIAVAVLAAIHFGGCRGEECPLGAPQPPPGP